LNILDHYIDGVLTQRTIDWGLLRSERNFWLKITDTWYLKDRWDELSTYNKGKLNSFRLALRDLPQDYSDAALAAVNFPDPEDWFI